MRRRLAAAGSPRWEVGSDFHWDPDAFCQTGFVGRPWLPGVYRLYATGTNAIAEILAKLRQPGVLHVPSFFCMDVVAMLSRHISIRWYHEIPDGHGPDFGTLNVDDGDAVLAVNLFGRSDRLYWDAWSAAHPTVLLIEDHSHDPLSEWARSSNADYVVASLRKTMPLPLGALLWSPRGLDLPVPKANADVAGHQRLLGMVLKAAWLNGARIEKDDYRQLLLAGECSLSAVEAAEATLLTPNILLALDVFRIRAARAANVREFHEVLGRTRSAGQRSPWALLRYGPVDSVPFNAQLLCASESLRDGLVSHLITHRIYPAVHWRQRGAPTSSGHSTAYEYSTRILTLPLDYRYSHEDICEVVRILNLFPYDEELLST